MFYNQKTINMSRASIVDSIVKFVSNSVGESFFFLQSNPGSVTGKLIWQQGFPPSMVVQEGCWAHLSTLLMDFHCQFPTLLWTTANGEAFLTHWSVKAPEGKICISFYEGFKEFLTDLRSYSCN